ncbi:MAG: protein-export chaperone SecB [Pseudomonadota bacterium]|nr:protein-export chaperone SecB [Pseudomonadota bacterium]
MAEEEGFAGTSDQPLNGEDTAPQVGMISQYVKDLSFENPNAPAVYQWQSQPQIEVQFNIGTNQLAEDVFEVALKIEVIVRADSNTAFAVDLLYAGLFAMRNLPAEQLQPFLLAEGPRLLFPFARRVVSDAIRDGGFPPLLLDPIDFGQLYMERAAQMQAEATGAQASLETGDA